jgi:protein-tyrosine phosphatase
MLACYLVAVEGYSATDAITETRRRRSWSIETEQQEQAVFDFEKSRTSIDVRDRGV